ncbi:hypothetical protein WJX73_007773 [Symbiochloris irregularis]|uniref:SHSP domain-containing protein n=1 Tax=Symbiochloris irregularis TaxID=706552 RepID=A0AAW1Q3L8_9CHLO
MAPELSWSRRVSVLTRHFTASCSRNVDIGLAECAASQAVLFARPAVEDTTYARPTTFDTKAEEPPSFARPAAVEDSPRRDQTRSTGSSQSPPRFAKPAGTSSPASHIIFNRPRQSAPTITPQVKTRETKNFYIIEARLPGVKAGDLQLRLQGNGLVLLGVKNPLVNAATPQGGKAKPFSATWPLPPAVDGSKITARHKGDRLMIILPKRV